MYVVCTDHITSDKETNRAPNEHVRTEMVLREQPGCADERRLAIAGIRHPFMTSIFVGDNGRKSPCLC